ncbi:MAG: NAD(P)-dependent oxidoreductase [Nitrosospira sp.]|nr:NAD(P)-dependent oxidoreductase [Nitrosospira sp.]
MPRLSVALTGATGFIGRLLLESLVRDGWKVRALTRKKRVNTEFIEWIQGDLDNKDALQDLVKNVFSVVHCAGAVRGSSLKDFAHTNVEGTANLVFALMQQDPAPRFLFMSSLAARQSNLSWYATSKYMAEQLVINLSGVVPWTIFRPTAVYGPGDKELSPIFRATRHGILPVIGGPISHYSLLHVDDLISAILCWLSETTSVQGIFELDDGTPGGYDCQSLAAIAQDIWKRPVKCFFLPGWLILFFAGINLYLSKILHYSPMLTPGKVREIIYPDWVCDITPLLKVLPCWRPRTRLRDALIRAV